MAKRFDKAYQVKVSLRGIRPPIWRRIQVPADYSFWDLHVAIQDAMGWWDYHLHAFRVADPSHGEEDLIGIPDEDRFVGDPEYLPGWTVPIDKAFAKPGDSASYEYDFGDGWEHEIVLEMITPREPKVRYPRCLAGERACPPEDCGGPWGYENMLKILADPRHEEHDETLTWVGGSYDPVCSIPRKSASMIPGNAGKRPLRNPERGSGAAPSRAFGSTESILQHDAGYPPVWPAPGPAARNHVLATPPDTTARRGRARRSGPRNA